MLKMILPILLGLLVWSASQAEAIEQCIPEPTDMEIEYGDTFMCDIEVTGDTDVFHFSGQAGDTIFVGVAEITTTSFLTRV